MSDDNIIKLPSKEPGNPSVNTDKILREIMASSVPIELPNGAKINIAPEGLGFKDMEAAVNMRDWIQKACEAKGGRMVGCGLGGGQADIDIELEGCRFNISIRPLP